MTGRRVVVTQAARVALISGAGGVLLGSGAGWLGGLLMVVGLWMILVALGGYR